MKHNWTLPSPGDIVWCLFPQIPEMEPGPKPRPVLVVQVEEREDGAIVSVVYGTSQNVKRLKTGEMVITRAMHPTAYALAGLAYDTKYDFKLIQDLPDLEKALILLYLEDRNHTEIAEIMGISLSNVGTRLARIREKLKKSAQTLINS